MQYKLNNNASINGTGLMGYVTLSCARMIELFGPPVEGDEYKVSGEWVFEDSSGNVFTVYDWKSTNLYCESYPTVEQFRAQPSYEFHVGGNTDASNFIKWLNTVANFVDSEVVYKLNLRRTR